MTISYAQVKKNRRQFLRDLRSGEFKQAYGQLKIRKGTKCFFQNGRAHEADEYQIEDAEPAKRDYHCCLGVGEDRFNPGNKNHNRGNWTPKTRRALGIHSKKFREFLASQDKDPDLEEVATNLNDTQGKTFKQIAKWFESVFKLAEKYGL